ncbi:MAG: hypothetical protein MK033_07395 [Candidatus Caenarcaniphilales bacterium]|nr:hypothetical protein [Candidatus Caenarcaniphilales bacterium]
MIVSISSDLENNLQISINLAEACEEILEISNNNLSKEQEFHFTVDFCDLILYTLSSIYSSRIYLALFEEIELDQVSDLKSIRLILKKIFSMYHRSYIPEILIVFPLNLKLIESKQGNFFYVHWDDQPMGKDFISPIKQKNLDIDLNDYKNIDPRYRIEKLGIKFIDIYANQVPQDILKQCNAGLSLSTKLDDQKKEFFFAMNGGSNIETGRNLVDRSKINWLYSRDIIDFSKKNKWTIKLKDIDKVIKIAPQIKDVYIYIKFVKRWKI